MIFSYVSRREMVHSQAMLDFERMTQHLFDPDVSRSSMACSSCHMARDKEGHKR